ncbi:MAG: ROK family protein [Mucilaginibacter sp.]|nr:ROK family protein [Mucilaginibacter sp.]
MVQTAIIMKKRKVNVNSVLHRFKDHQLHEDLICKFAKEGDIIAGAVLDATGRSLGVTLMELAKRYEPEAFILTGMMTEAGARLIGPAQEILDRWARQKLGKCIKLLSNKLSPMNAAIIGTAVHVKEKHSVLKRQPMLQA